MCDHEPIYYREYKKLLVKPNEKIYLKRLNTEHIIQRLAFSTAILGLLTALILLGKEFFYGNNNSTIVYCNKCKCDCDYEDVTGKANGKEAKFRFVYITREKRWQFESEIELNDGSLLKEVVDTTLRNLQNYDKAIGTIAVGTSSQEGSIKEKEEQRADRRADAIVFNLRVNELSRSKDIFKLNLGQHQGKSKLSKSETAYQRRVIIVAIMSKDKDMSPSELKESLRNAFSNTEELNFNTNDYTLFDFSKVN